MPVLGNVSCKKHFNLHPNKAFLWQKLRFPSAFEKNFQFFSSQQEQAIPTLAPVFFALVSNGWCVPARITKQKFLVSSLSHKHKTHCLLPCIENCCCVFARITEQKPTLFVQFHINIEIHNLLLCFVICCCVRTFHITKVPWEFSFT